MDSYSLEKGKKVKKSSTRRRLTLVILAVIGVILMVGGSVVYVHFFPLALKEKVAEALIISAGSEAEERFTESPVPVYFNFYVFNVTNRDDVNENGAKPKLQELGPYVFRLEKIRKIQGWDPEEGTVIFHEFKKFYFDPKRTKGSLKDRINHVNAVSIGIGAMMQKQVAIFRALGLSVDEMISDIRGEYIDTHTVAEMLFDGYVIKKYFPIDGEHLCRLKNNCTFAFWQNNTKSFMMEANTGAKGTDHITHIVRYNNESSLPYWFGDECNAINGSAGPQFKPGMTQDETFYAFSPEICRSVVFEFTKSSSVEGIPTLQYQISEDTLSYQYQKNKCFCPTDTEKCEDIEGLMMLGTCHDGGPVAVSWPHFYLGTKEQLENVEGLHPDKEKHSTYVNLEPITGSALGGFKRMQANIIVNPDSRIKALRHIKKTVYFPVFWVEETGSIDETTASKFRAQVLVPLRVGKWSLWSAMAVGAFLLLATMITWAVKRT